MTAELKAHQGRRLPLSFLESYKGRMLYAAGHTYGRCTHLACQLLRKLSNAGVMVQVSIELVQASIFALELLRTSGPRMVAPWCSVPLWLKPLAQFFGSSYQ